jgi:hypothetical protein
MGASFGRGEMVKVRGKVRLCQWCFSHDAFLSVQSSVENGGGRGRGQ